MTTGCCWETFAVAPVSTIVGPTGSPGPTSTVSRWLTCLGSSRFDSKLRSSHTIATVEAGSFVVDPVSLPRGDIAAWRASPESTSIAPAVAEHLDVGDIDRQRDRVREHQLVLQVDAPVVALVPPRRRRDRLDDRRERDLDLRGLAGGGCDHGSVAVVATASGDQRHRRDGDERHAMPPRSTSTHRCGRCLTELLRCGCGAGLGRRCDGTRATGRQLMLVRPSRTAAMTSRMASETSTGFSSMMS